MLCDDYGKSKAAGEPKQAVVLRCSIIGPERGDTAYGLFEWYLHSKQVVNGFVDHYWNGLTTYELSKQIYSLIDRRDFTPRVQHFYSGDIVKAIVAGANSV